MIINDLFPDYGRASCNTGNMYITGLANMGAEGCLLQLMCDFYTENNPIFYFDDHLAREKKHQIIRNATSRGYRISDINNLSCFCMAFDLFSPFENVEEKADIVYSFLSDKDDSLDLVNQLCRYFQDCILALRGKGRHVSMKEVLNLSIEDVKYGLHLSTELDDFEKRDEMSFLEARETYRIWEISNDRARRLKACGILDILSGTASAYDVFDKKILVMVNQSVGTLDAAKISLSLSNGFVSLLGKICEKRNDYNKPYHIFIKDSTELKSSQLEMLLNVTMNAPFALPLCIFDQSVTKTISIHSSYFLDYFGSFSIFKTNEGAFWSEFLGTMLTPERTETYSRRRFPILAASGGVLPRRNSRYEGTTVHRIEKPLYEARVFSALKEKCLIFYNVYSNRKSRKQLRW